MNTAATLTASSLMLFAGAALAQPTFQAMAPVPTGQRPGDVAFGDLDGDTHVDMVYSNDTPDSVSIRLGSSTGTFGAPVNFPTGANTGPDSFAVADFDGDLDLDVAVVLKNINTVQILVNTGGTLSFGDATLVGEDPRRIYAVDLDNDGDQDLLTSNRDSNTVSVLTNTGGAFNVSASLAAGERPVAAVGADLDGDGDAEVIASNNRGRAILVFTNNGGAFGAPTSIGVNPTLRPEGLDVGDVDGDGDTDVVAALSDDNLGFVGILTNNGGALSSPVNVGSGGVDTDSVTLGDFDGDNDLDIAATNEGSNNIGVLVNTGGSFALSTTLATGLNPERVTRADINGDNLPELAAANRDSNSISIFENTTDLGTDCLADVNGDGVLSPNDFTAWIDAFNNSTPECDQNGDGACTPSDFTAWINNYNAGC